MAHKADLLLDFGASLGEISPMIYGHFAEHIGGVYYDGLWVGEDSKVENVRGFRKALVDSFKKISPPVLRWPGGCFAETYDWRDGIGPKENRPERVNWWYTFDKRTETNQVGTHEFCDFCEMVGAEPYFAANMTSTTPLHIRNWAEYVNLPENLTTLTRERAQNGHPAPFDVKYWGIGNENWGGGGQMSPEMYMREYMRYSAVINSLDRGRIMKFIMCGANGHDIDWTRRIMQEMAKTKYPEAATWGMSVHYYCGTAGTPQEFTKDQWYELLFKADFMRRIVDDHRAAMDEFDPERKIALVVDEWGCWHKDGTGPSGGYNLFEQQSSMRDAVVAALTLNIFNNRSDVVKMANVAQLCNNLHSLYLAGGEHFVETPNYHVFDMFKTHQGAKHVRTRVKCDILTRDGYRPLEMVSASASEKDGMVTITLANLSAEEEAIITLSAAERSLPEKGVFTILAHEDLHAVNDFENPKRVTPTSKEISLSGAKEIRLPKGAVAALVLG
ncbi:MAG: alpha-N-arabinofuranosidase [Clostridia bacterium]|nr:alpha-N-arabinofuranosidase [Clostridia bacterium]